MNGLAAALAVLLSVPAVALGDLGGYLERSAAAEFSGEQAVSCDTPDGARSSVFQLTQADGSVAAWSAADADSVVTVGPGLAAARTGDETDAAVVEAVESNDSSPSYRIGESEQVIFLGRDADEVSILRDGIQRVLLTVDVDSDVVVRTRTYEEDGDLYCDRRMISFQPGVSDVPVMAAQADVEPAVPLDDAVVNLPREVEGFLLLDTYPVADGTLSYYSDGFFTFGVVLTDRPVGIDADAVVFPADTGSYRRVYEAGRVTMAWSAGSQSIALIGDMPPDLTDAVLEELPAPESRSLLSRIWDRLFD